jgi:hypothetical protein
MLDRSPQGGRTVATTRVRRTGDASMAEYPVIHGPSRPDWTCVACDDPWPCIIRKRQLKELCQCNIRTMVNYMMPYLRDAQEELVGISTAEVADRFVNWCSRPLPRKLTSENGSRL